MSDENPNQSSNTTNARFVELVSVQIQQAAMALGQIPNPMSGKAEVNLEMAKVFIDFLSALREKTKGNVSEEESRLLAQGLSGLQLAFVEARNTAQSKPEAATASAAETAPTPEESSTPAGESAESGASPQKASEAVENPETESKKKFTKSYGA